MPPSTGPPRHSTAQNHQPSAWGASLTGSRALNTEQTLLAQAQSHGTLQAGSDLHSQDFQPYDSLDDHQRLQPSLIHTHPPRGANGHPPHHEFFSQPESQAPATLSTYESVHSLWAHPQAPVAPQGMLPSRQPQSILGIASHPMGAGQLQGMIPGDQMSAQHIPVVSPSFVPVAAVAGRSYQPASRNNYQPDAPLHAFAQQEAHVHAEAANNDDDDDLMNDIFAQNAQDNDPNQAYGAYEPASSVQPGECHSPALHVDSARDWILGVCCAAFFITLAGHAIPACW